MSQESFGGQFIYPKSTLIINNGEDCISLDRGEIAKNLEEVGFSQETIMRLLSEVNEYSNNVKNELENGVHLGSTDLISGVHSIFYTRNDPAYYGLTDSSELIKAANMIEKFCKKENRKFIPGKIRNI